MTDQGWKEYFPEYYFLYALFPDRPTHIFSDFARRTTNRLGLALQLKLIWNHKEVGTLDKEEENREIEK